jgi:ADP-heptose:LPS heptosyltransferase
VIGLSDAREGARFFYDHAVDVSDVAHAVDRYLALTRFAVGDAGPGLDAVSPPEILPWGSAPAGFKPEDRFVVLHPFSRGAGKSLTVEQVREFCQALPGEKVVVAGRADVELPPIEGVVDLLNKTSLTELIWLLRFAKFVVSVDSGPMHMAAAVSKGLVSIHTWSDPAKVGPYSPDAWVWKDGKLFRMRDIGDAGKWQAAGMIGDVAGLVKGWIG